MHNDVSAGAGIKTLSESSASGAGSPDPCTAHEESAPSYAPEHRDL